MSIEMANAQQSSSEGIAQTPVATRSFSPLFPEEAIPISAGPPKS